MTRFTSFQNIMTSLALILCDFFHINKSFERLFCPCIEYDACESQPWLIVCPVALFVFEVEANKHMLVKYVNTK